MGLFSRFRKPSAVPAAEDFADERPSAVAPDDGGAPAGVVAEVIAVVPADGYSLDADLQSQEEFQERWDALLADLERLKQLKRDGDLDSARVLALDLVERAEGLAQEEVTVSEDVVFAPAPAPAYTKEAAIVLRKLKDYDAEVEVLERYERAARGAGVEYTVGDELINDRLPKARALRDKARKAT